MRHAVEKRATFVAAVVLRFARLRPRSFAAVLTVGTLTQDCEKLPLATGR
jgi:hypothetical protein